MGSGATGHPCFALVYTDFSCVFAGRPGVEPGLQRPFPRVPPQALWFLASCWRQQLPFCLRRVCLLLSACCWPLCIPPPSQQQYVGSAAQAEAGLLARTLPGIYECLAKSAGPAGMQMLMH